MNNTLLLQHFDLLATAPGGVAKLRELILTLAVQGKLAPQDLADEPASELLKRIRAEKDRLIAEKVLKREKETPTLAEGEFPFELPATWSWVALGEVIDIVRGITFPATQKTREAAQGRIACLRTSNVQHEIEWDDLLFVDRSFMGRDDQLIQHHDIVMSMANSRELVGKVALIEKIPHPEATFGGFLGVLRPRKIDPRFAMAVLRTPYARLQLIDSSSQTTNIANVSLAKLRPLPFPLPPQKEQARIVARVEELMRVCDALEAQGQQQAAHHRQLVQTLLGTLTGADRDPDSTTPTPDAWQRVDAHFDTLLDRPSAVDTLEQTILQLAVRGQLVPQDPTDEPASELLKRIRAEKDRLIAEGKIKRDKPLAPIGDDEQPFELPRGWEWVRCGDYFLELCTGPFGSMIHQEDYVTGGVPLINPSHMISGRITHDPRVAISQKDAERLSTYALSAGDMVLARRGEVGRYALVTDQENGWLCGTGSFFVRLHRVCDRDYLGLVFTDGRFRQHLQGESVGSTMTNLNQRILLDALIALPPLPEQTRIVARVAQLRSLCADMCQRLTQSQNTQAALAEALVSTAG